MIAEAHTRRAVGAREVTLGEVRCDGCGSSMVLELATGLAGCADGQCSAAGMGIPLSILLEEAGIDHNPAGRARPVRAGRPVPWLSLVSEHGPHFGLIHGLRLVAAQREFLCQVCGHAVDAARAAAVVGPDGRFLTSAPLHPGECATLAQRWCPAVSGRGTVVTFARGQHHAGGPAIPEYGFAQAWRLPASGSSGPAPHTGCPAAGTVRR